MLRRSSSIPEHDGHIVVVVCRYNSKMLIDVISARNTENSILEALLDDVYLPPIFAE